jgi:twitching motility two-component system response regulator PilH
VKKILIVDDSMAMVRMIQSVPEKEGYRAIGISNPSQIEQTIDSEGPSLILLDVVMPDRNGFQVCRALKNSEAYKSIPIIVVSGKSTRSDRFWAEQQGADGYIVKPFAPVDLLREVRWFA